MSKIFIGWLLGMICAAILIAGVFHFRAPSIPSIYCAPGTCGSVSPVLRGIPGSAKIIWI